MARFGFPYDKLLLNLGNHFFLSKNKKILNSDEPSHSAEARRSSFEATMKAENFQDWLNQSFAFANTYHHLAPDASDASDDKMPRPLTMGEPKKGLYGSIDVRNNLRPYC